MHVPDGRQNLSPHPEWIVARHGPDKVTCRPRILRSVHWEETSGEPCSAPVQFCPRWIPSSLLAFFASYLNIDINRYWLAELSFANRMRCCWSLTHIRSIHVLAT